VLQHVDYVLKTIEYTVV